MAKSILMAPLLAVFAALSAAGAAEAPVWAEDFPDPTTWRAPDGTSRISRAGARPSR